MVWYRCHRIWQMWQYIHNRVNMVIADCLVPIWHQDLLLSECRSPGFIRSPSIHPSIHIHFWLRCYPCPIPSGWQHQAMSNTGSPCMFVTGVNASQATLTDISLLTFRPHLSRPSLYSNAGIRKVCRRLIQDVARCTWPYHLNHRLQ